MNRQVVGTDILQHRKVTHGEFRRHEQVIERPTEQRRSRREGGERAAPDARVEIAADALE